MSGMVKRALDRESGDLGLILVSPMTHFVALWLSLTPVRLLGFQSQL